MKVKTSELTGPALRWAVALARAPEVKTLPHNPWAVVENFHPDANWAQGGPIIEREGISLWENGTEPWDASMSKGRFVESGPTPLIAAMRAFVASRLGDEVDVPEELK